VFALCTGRTEAKSGTNSGINKEQAEEEVESTRRQIAAARNLTAYN